MALICASTRHPANAILLVGLFEGRGLGLPTMLATLTIVLPVFALIFAGWLARRIGVLGEAATAELNRFVVYLSLPVLLFDIVAHADWAVVWHPGFVLTYGLSAMAVFAAALVAARLRRAPLADAAIDGLNVGYGNTGYMGFPLALLAFGPAAMAPTLLATILTISVVFAGAIVLIEIALQTEARPGRLALQVGGSLIRNPLVVAPALGFLVPVFGLAIPAPVDSFLKLMGGAASPCALVALGLFLASGGKTARPPAGPVALLVGLKLIAHPLIAWVLATLVFRLPPTLVHTAVLMAALPTGTGPFMLAEKYERDARITAAVILISTVISVLTISAYLAWAS
jgi:malonate transporter